MPGFFKCPDIPNARFCKCTDIPNVLIFQMSGHCILNIIMNLQVFDRKKMLKKDIAIEIMTNT